VPQHPHGDHRTDCTGTLALAASVISGTSGGRQGSARDASVVEGSNDTLTVTFNDRVLGLDESTAGLLAGAYGVGMALGGLLLTGLAQRRLLAPVVLAGACLLGLSQVAVAWLAGLLPVMIALGVGVSMILVSARTLLQRTTEDAILARVLAIQEGVRIVGLALGAMIGPALVIWLGPSLAFVPLGALVLTLGLLSQPATRRLEATAVTREEEIALLRRVPFLAALPPYETERLAQSAVWREVAAGTPVVTQGDIGDTYYLVARGELSVHVDGRLRDHTLLPGDGFGEIALLSRIPRTATVTALTDCRLLSLDSTAFLSAVTSTPEVSDLVHRHADALIAEDGRL
jgi:MFS family permease